MLARAVLTASLPAVFTACSVLPGSAPEAPSTPGTGTGDGTLPPVAVTEPAQTPDPVVPEDFRQEAAGIVADLSDEELAGSVVMATYAGTDGAAAADLVTDLHLAGVIVMGTNLPAGAGPADVHAIVQEIGRGTSAEAAADVPVLVGVDEEGGPVARLDGAGPVVPPLLVHGAAADPQVSTAVTRAQGAGLRDLGFTLDFAPVADVTIGAADPTINVRSAGSDPETVAEVVAGAVTGYGAAGIASSAKHFPGHGALDTDSHLALPESDRTIAEMANTDLPPFEAAVEAGVSSVMMGHIDLPGGGALPASLDPEAYAELRERLGPEVGSGTSSDSTGGDRTGYEGVVVTDALNMGAVTQSAGSTDAALQAIAAGADLALMPSDTAASVAAIEAALDSGDLPRDRLVEASERVMALRLWQADAAATAREDAEGSDGTEAALDTALADLGAAALTVAAGPCRVEDTGAGIPGSVEVEGASATDVEVFATAAEDAGLEVVEGGGDLRVAIDGTDGDVLVSTQAPWDATALVDAAGDDIPVLFTYDDYAQGLAAAADWVAGEATAPGRLPVEVDGLDPPDCG